MNDLKTEQMMKLSLANWRKELGPSKRKVLK